MPRVAFFARRKVSSGLAKVEQGGLVADVSSQGAVILAVGWLSGAIWLPFLGAMLHPLLGMFTQKAAGKGVGMTVIVASANLITLAIFAVYMDAEGGWTIRGQDWWAIGNGVIFFLGQWFSLQSMKVGDLAVHASALGVKVLVVASFSFLVGLEEASFALVLGVVAAVTAVFLVSGGSLAGWKEHRKTVGLTLLACIFFGTNDFLTGWAAQDIGAGRWLLLMMGTSGAISALLLLTRLSQLRALLTGPPRVAGCVLGAGLCLGTQALFVNLAFSKFQEPTLSNVVYSSRGLMAVIVLWITGASVDHSLRRKQTLGAVLMMGALLIVLSRQT